MSVVFTESVSLNLLTDDQLCVREMQPGDPNQQWMRCDQHIRNRADQNRVLDIMGDPGHIDFDT